MYQAPLFLFFSRLITRDCMRVALHHILVASTYVLPHRTIPIHCSVANAGDNVAEVLIRCAQLKSAPAAAVLQALEAVDANPRGLPASRADIQGDWELIFSSAAAKVPFIDGYMPNREILKWDLDSNQLELEIETLPMLPKISVVGRGLVWNEDAQTLTYAVNDKPPSEWQLLFMDRDSGVVAARSSVTGLNVIRKL